MNRICSLNLTFKILEFAIFWKYSTGFWFESSDKTPNNRLKFLISSCSNLYAKESIWKEMCLIKHILLRHFQNLQQSIQNYFRQTKLNFLYSFPKTIESYFRFLFIFCRNWSFSKRQLHHLYYWLQELCFCKVQYL